MHQSGKGVNGVHLLLGNAALLMGFIGLGAPKDHEAMLGVAGLEPQQALLSESVLEYVSPVAWVDSRTQESQRGRNDLSWFGPIGALRPAADDPST